MAVSVLRRRSGLSTKAPTSSSRGAVRRSWRRRSKRSEGMSPWYRATCRTSSVSIFGQITREKGRLDVVFANAGVAKSAPIGTITEELYDSIFDVNVKGLLFT